MNKMNEDEFVIEFRKEYPNSNLKRGALMQLYDMLRYTRLDETESGLIFMKDLGIITGAELNKLVKETSIN